MDALKNNVLQVIGLIEDTSSHFYQQKGMEGYQLLDKTINEIIVTMNIISSYSSKNHFEIVNEQELQAKLGMAIEALEKKNIILIADILTYEIKYIFEYILTQKD